MTCSLLKKYIVCAALLPFVFACSDAGDRVNVTDPANEEAYAKYMAGIGNSSSGNEGGASNCIDTLEQNEILDSCNNGDTACYNIGLTSDKYVSLKCQNDRWYATGIEFDSLTDERDGQTYKTVKIGEQTWMAENLNYAPDSVRNGGYTRMSCYDDYSTNCETYGRLYTWDVVMNDSLCAYGRQCNATNDKKVGLCPDGWFLPSYKDFTILYETVGGTANAAYILKSVDGWDYGGNGLDLYGFSLRPAGNWANDSNNADFYSLGGMAYLWSSTEYNIYNVSGEVFSYEHPEVERDSLRKFDAFSVRCIKD